MDADQAIELLSAPEVRAHPLFERPLQTSVREARLLDDAPWVRSLGKLQLDVTTQGWRFPAPPDDARQGSPALRLHRPQPDAAQARPRPEKTVRPKPPRDAVVFKERLLYLLQPPLENVFTG